MKKNKKFAGFTLIELLATIVIIGTLSTISVSTFQGHFEKARIARAKAFASETEGRLKAKTIASQQSLISDCSFNEIIDNGFSCLAGPNLSVANMPIDNSFLSEDTPANSGKSYFLPNGQYYATSYNFPVKKANGITISAWLKEDFIENEGIRSFFSINQELVFQIKLENNVAKLIVETDGQDLGSHYYEFSSPSLNAGWHHLLGSFDYNTKTIKFYLNGKLINKNVLSGINYISQDTNSSQLSVTGSGLVYSLKFYPLAIDNEVALDIAEESDNNDEQQ
jgi:prepilin-type N-terminal cleavage/methylation domain-containing protein